MFTFSAQWGFLMSDLLKFIAFLCWCTKLINSIWIAEGKNSQDLRTWQASLTCKGLYYLPKTTKWRPATWPVVSTRSYSCCLYKKHIKTIQRILPATQWCICNSKRTVDSQSHAISGKDGPAHIIQWAKKHRGDWFHFSMLGCAYQHRETVWQTEYSLQLCPCLPILRTCDYVLLHGTGPWQM